MRRAMLRCLVTLGLAWPLAALACGVCIEDNMAVTWDHAVVERAAARGHVVVFASIDARTAPRAASEGVKAAAMRARGVDRTSVRAATAPLAVSFALDPRVQAPAVALAAIEKAAAQPGLRLTLLRVVD
jgi:hypothetical protein